MELNEEQTTKPLTVDDELNIRVALDEVEEEGEEHEVPKLADVKRQVESAMAFGSARDAIERSVLPEHLKNGFRGVIRELWERPHTDALIADVKEVWDNVVCLDARWRATAFPANGVDLADVENAKLRNRYGEEAALIIAESNHMPADFKLHYLDLIRHKLALGPLCSPDDLRELLNYLVQTCADVNKHVSYSSQKVDWLPAPVPAREVSEPAAPVEASPLPELTQLTQLTQPERRGGVDCDKHRETLRAIQRLEQRLARHDGSQEEPSRLNAFLKDYYAQRCLRLRQYLADSPLSTAARVVVVNEVYAIMEDIGQ